MFVARARAQAVISQAVPSHRYDLLDLHWEKAVKIGANQNLGPLMRLHLTDSNLLVGHCNASGERRDPPDAEVCRRD